jgi:NAD(P)-dependent dehydrogenase (short-subunit alcohol dehydrogenase family)
VDSGKKTSFAKYPSLQDRVVLITGGASGIGEVLVEAFTLQGAQVVFLDIADEAASALIDRLSPNAAYTPVYVHCDLTDSAQLIERLAGIIARFGTIDVVINNADDDTRHVTEDVTPEFWDRCTAVNLKHQFFVSQAVVPGMKWQGRGVILNMSSIASMIPSTGLPVYVASKAAIVGLTRTLAHELGPHGIRVNCILPGAIETARQKRLWHLDEYKATVLDNQALQRFLQPEEVARLALFLAADDASAITSQSDIVDGGWI